ncbi:Polyisoprenoid-binding protein YceI [Raineyella antarctica]|uniref:Polyisoprenoid-binding protein YceI n=1 Tax=Raineyella antarctica TaxID=1577474 RepID=A0A1G6I7Y7_9ACTN|nr:YceI family protein [Raineyella antarctica]SDC02647.1 Polyisoprenoid-binding protein YceI [Raineyella antarctica]
MSLAPGTRTLTQDDGEFLLLTTVEGRMARMGHELALRIDRWTATLTVGPEVSATALQVSADLRSLSLKGSRDPGKPVSEKDARDILSNAQKTLQVQQHAEVSFTSTSAEGTWEAVTLQGDLTLHGHTRPQVLRVVATESGYRLTGQVAQSDFGIKPYSIMMGALKVGDRVDVEVSVRL